MPLCAIDALQCPSQISLISALSNTDNPHLRGSARLPRPSPKSQKLLPSASSIRSGGRSQRRKRKWKPSQLRPAAACITITGRILGHTGITGSDTVTPLYWSSFGACFLAGAKEATPRQQGKPASEAICHADEDKCRQQSPPEKGPLFCVRLINKTGTSQFFQQARLRQVATNRRLGPR